MLRSLPRGRSAPMKMPVRERDGDRRYRYKRGVEESIERGGPKKGKALAVCELSWKHAAETPFSRLDNCPSLCVCISIRESVWVECRQ